MTNMKKKLKKKNNLQSKPEKGLKKVQKLFTINRKYNNYLRND